MDLEAQIAALRADLARERRRADDAEDALRVERAQLTAVSPAPPRVPSRSWTEADAGFFTCVVGRAVTRGEDDLLRLRWPDGWLVATGLEVTDSNRSREIDALVVTPRGVVVVEQKDTAARGLLSFPPNDVPLLDDQEFPRFDGAVRQTRLAAQVVASILEDARINAGFISAVLAIRGSVMIADRAVGSTWITRTSQLVEAITQLTAERGQDLLTAGSVQGLLVQLGLPVRGLPALDELGFAALT